MHSIPVSYPISAAAAATTGFIARSIARANGSSEREAWQIGSAAGAAAGIAAAHITSVVCLDPVGGHVVAAHHTVALGHHLVSLTTQQVPAIQITP